MIETLLLIPVITALLGTITEADLILQSELNNEDLGDPLEAIRGVLHNPRLNNCRRFAFIHDGGLDPHKLDKIVKSVPMENEQNSVMVANIRQLKIIKDKYMGDDPLAIYNLEHDLWQDMYMPAAKVPGQCEVVFVLHGNSEYDILDRFRIKMFSMKFLNDRRVRSNFVFWSRMLSRTSILRHTETRLFRFKIVLSLSESQKLWSADYKCFSCGQGGKSEIVTLDMLKINHGWLKTSELFPYPLTNYNGKVYRQQGTSVPLYCMVKRIKGKWMPAGGNWFSLHKECYKRLNGSFVLSAPTNDQGARLENGTFTGCLGELFKGKQDIQTGNIVFYEQNAYFDFTTFILSFPLVMIVPETKPIRDWITVFRPFSMALWICLLSAVIFAMLFIRFQAWIVSNWDVYSDRRHLAEFMIEHGTKIPGKSIMWQGVKIRQTGGGFKPFITAWFFFALMMITLFNGKLMASLINPPMESAIETLSDLERAVEHRGYTLGFASLGTAANKLFTSAKSGLFHKLNEKMTITSDGTNCIRRTQKEKFVCIGLESAANIFSISMFTDKYGRYTVYRAREKFYEHYGAFMMNKADPLLPKYNWIITKTIESGVMDHWFDEEVRAELTKVRKRRKDDIDDDDSNQPKPLRLRDHLVGLFVISGILMALGLTAFILEVFTFYVDKAFQKLQMKSGGGVNTYTDVKELRRSLSVSSLRLPFLN